MKNRTFISAKYRFMLIGGTLCGAYGMFAGLMLSQPAGSLLTYLYISARYGKENYALFLAGRENNARRRLYDFAVTPELIVKVRDEIG